MPAVSVIIPTYNRKNKLLRAISSVFNQTFTDFEVIVVDDGSIDDTKNALEHLNFPIKYISHSTNLGVSAARNSGIRLGDSTFITFLDSDDYWLSDKLKVQIDYFQEHKQSVACQTDEIWIRNGRRVNPKIKHLKPSGHIFKESLKLCLVSPSAVMLKRSVLDEVGLFDENLPACEDYDLWLRISCRHPICLIPQQLIVKEGGHPDQLSRRYKGMDRFRIIALVNLVERGILDDQQLSLVFEELKIKCNIYGMGCIKRGRKYEGLQYLKLPEQIKRK